MNLFRRITYARNRLRIQPVEARRTKGGNAVRIQPVSGNEDGFDPQVDLKPRCMSNASPMGSILPLTGLRAFAAGWVVAVHFYYDVDFGLLTKFVLAGNHGVDIFFVLSGFILTVNYGNSFKEPGDLKRFFILRVARLYPVHTFILLAIPLLVMTGAPLLPPPPNNDTAYTFVLNTLMLHA